MKIWWIAALTGLALLSACSRAPEKKTFKAVSYTQTNEVVQKEEITLKPDKFVEVDFNADGRMDLAVIEEPENVETNAIAPAAANTNVSAKEKATGTLNRAENEVGDSNKGLMDKVKNLALFKGRNAPDLGVPLSQLTIYIQESDGKYYLGGKIIDIKDGNIIGLAYKKNDTEYYDLLLMYQYNDGRNEIVRYKNDGSSFRLAEE